MPILLPSLSTPDLLEEDGAWTLSPSRVYSPRLGVPLGDAPPPWKKLLYLRQPYPDNYTDRSFLSQLKRNTTVLEHNHAKVLHDFSLVVSHVDALTVAALVFHGLHNHSWHEATVLATASACTVALAAARLPVVTLLGAGTPVLVLLLTVMVLLPVLKLLTRTTSSDSVWAILFFLNTVNLVTHDYSGDAAGPPPFSTNLLIANLAMLALRLRSSTAVFCFIVVCIQIHGMAWAFDAARAYHQPVLPPAVSWTLLTAVFVMLGVAIYAMCSTTLAVLWVAANVAILGVGPWYYVRLQRYKNELQGPWDPAVVGE